MDTSTKTTEPVTPWNKGKLLGQKPPLELKEIWAIPISHEYSQCAVGRHRSPSARVLAIVLRRQQIKIPGQNWRALVRGRPRRCAGWLAIMLTSTSKHAHSPSGRTGPQSRSIASVLVRQSRFAFLLTTLDLALPC
jgi:hypothetical protein